MQRRYRKTTDDNEAALGDTDDMDPSTPLSSDITGTPRKKRKGSHGKKKMWLEKEHDDFFINSMLRVVDKREGQNQGNP